ncbi:NUDIX domain-containing protein [Paenibacillus soyae]|uniref:NUDIX domain-containing protein n=1 Tax=Paenibacillus soyae TaxID=2969249 RepID=A0A9X2MUS1_9BACL|nr:NUDIX domain-containing protein [Paenibacillus soyae]MCR2803982.1 NUDIX domain-containing protein [Paenibacillus soyae]
MRLIRQLFHKDVNDLQGKTFEQRSARGIILDGSKILLIYTKRYNDYSFPGGGVAEDEDLFIGLHRELAEETGASRTKVLQEFGYIDEYRPHHKPEYDLIHMESYFYVCEIDHDFANVRLEDYEVANGSYPVWVDIREAIEHNRKVMANQEPSMGFSIERETIVLELVEAELIGAGTK